MPNVFRKRQAEEADEPIPEDVLASIPEVRHAAPGEATKPPRVAETGRKGRKGAAAAQRHAPAAQAPDVAGLVAEVRRQMDTVFERELAKVEDTFAGRMREMEARLAAAQAELEALRGENRQLLGAKGDYERKLQAFKELSRSLDER